MIPDDPELRRALAARSGVASPDFRSRVMGSLPVGAPARGWMPAIAFAVVVALCVGSIGLLLHARQAQRSGLASGPRVTSPTPSPADTPPFMPGDAQLSAPSRDVVWALVNHDHLYLSLDQGVGWTQRSVPADIGGPASTISFINADEGWFLATGSPATECQQETGTLWHTDDGARTWRRLVTTGISDNECKESISFADARRGFMTSWDDLHRPVVYRTLDGGRTWKGVTLTDPPGYRTEGGGFTLRAGFVRDFGGVLLVDAQGQSAITGRPERYAYRSSDGGASWYPRAYAGPATGELVFLTATRWLILQTDDCLRDAHVLAACPPGSAGPGARATDDAGGTWMSFTTDYDDAAGVASTFVFADAQVGYATVRGDFHRTVDGGVHWVMPATPWSQAAG